MSTTAPIQDPLFIFHKNAGALLIVLLALRLVWRATHRAPPLPDSLPTIQKFAARATHVALYLLLIVMAVSGYVRVRAGGFPVELLDAIGVPNFVPRDDELAQTAKVDPRPRQIRHRPFYRAPCHRGRLSWPHSS